VLKDALASLSQEGKGGFFMRRVTVRYASRSIFKIGNFKRGQCF